MDRSRINRATRLRPLHAMLAALATLLLGLAVVPAGAKPGNDNRAPELPAGCETLKVDAGHKVAFEAYAEGVQIYRWNAGMQRWDLVGPDAVLFADAVGRGVVGIHYGGPTWQSNSGSKVVGTAPVRCTVDPDAIPWLKLSVASSEGPGVFEGITFIQRVNTTGGKAPATNGTTDGLAVRVPYTADYVFYRKQG